MLVLYKRNRDRLQSYPVCSFQKVKSLKVFKMWSFFVTVLGLFSLSAGYIYQPSILANTFGNIETQLDNLNLNIERLYERQEGQNDRIGNLIESSSHNLGFQFDFNDIAREDVYNEIAVQNERLQRLAGKIAQIKGLKSQVGKLQYNAEAIRDVLSKTNAADVATLDIVTDLADNETATLPQITEAVSDAVCVRDGLEGIIIRIDESSRILSALEFRTEQIISTLDFNTAEASEHSLQLKNGVAKLTINYPGFSRHAEPFVTGFHLYRSQRYRAGTPRQIFIIEVDSATNIEIHAYDLSSNGWYSEVLYFVVLANKFQVSRLDIRYPFENQGSPKTVTTF